jgi:hypothetical protein
MLRYRSSASFVCALGACLVAITADSSDALACGACFHPPPRPLQVDSTVVTDHRMAFSISPLQTVLWDQIRYSGSPSDFAWVLPVKAGARIELSQDSWLAALDASTQKVILGPVPSCGGAPPVQYENSGGGGGGCMGSSSSSAGGAGYFAADAGAGDDAGSSTPQVQVISQEVVGPYDAVTVRSSQGEALGVWLRANGYDIALAFQPTIDAYTAQGFDFIALRLQPGVGVQAMQPVRVVTPGADPTLPLRMVAAGVGAHVGFELYVLSEGRYHTQNFPDEAVDFSKLQWDPYNSISTYSTLVQQALSANGGSGWLTEFAGQADLGSFSTGLNPSLYVAYRTQCVPRPMVCTPVPTPTSAGDAGDDSAGLPGTGATPDAGGEASLLSDSSSTAEAGSGEGGLPDAGAIGSGAEAGPTPAPTQTVCTAAVVCDDLDLAMTGIVSGGLWVTRLKADFPAAALATDLVLEATPSQESVSNVHQTDQYTDPKYSPCSNVSSNGAAPAAPSPSSGTCACRLAGSQRARHTDTIVASLGLAAMALAMRRRRRG